MEDILESGQDMEDIMASGQVTVSDNNTEITLEGLSLEPHVVRRKRSLVSVLRRRLARSLHELEVCRIQREEEEKGGEGEAESDEDVAGDSWMKNTLRFESNDPVLAKDASTKVCHLALLLFQCFQNMFFSG